MCIRDSLDAGAAAAVRQTLHRLARTRPVIAATHDETLVSEADAHIRLTSAARPAVTDRSVPAASAADTTSGYPAAPAGSRDTAASDEQTAAPAVPTGTLLRRLATAVDMRSVKFWLAVFYGVAAVAAGAALTGVSAWLIVRASAPVSYTHLTLPTILLV